MKLTEVSVTSGVTVSFKKFRFIRLEYTLSATISDKEDAASAMDQLRVKLREKLARDAKKEVAAWRKLGAQVEAMGSTPEPAIDFD